MINCCVVSLTMTNLSHPKPLDNIRELSYSPFQISVPTSLSTELNASQKTHIKAKFVQLI